CTRGLDNYQYNDVIGDVW
nr:immunoglobulin heavy chain junction region [Macaca mulatta]MOY20866.1 immunoglobulin heavy chain junction region [Macaca mulatta]